MNGKLLLFSYVNSTCGRPSAGMFEHPSSSQQSRSSSTGSRAEEGEEVEDEGEEGEGGLGFFQPAESDDSDSDREAQHQLPSQVQSGGVDRWEEPGGGARWDGAGSKWLFPPSILSTHQW